jgi:hypothetical protein
MLHTLRSLAAALLLWPATAFAAPAIVFDTVPGGAGGTLTYDGAGGPAIGSGIVFVNVNGLDTPANNGATIPCVTCQLAFTTGANTQEGPPAWTWAGGGSFVLHGSIPALGIADEDLLVGTFTSTANTPGLAGADPNALFIALGIDAKNPDLAAFFGLGPNDFTFANTEIALGTFVSDPVTGAFTAVPNQADIINVAQVPTPAALLLLGLGLLSAPLLRRR